MTLTLERCPDIAAKPDPTIRTSARLLVRRVGYALFSEQWADGS